MLVSFVYLGRRASPWKWGVEWFGGDDHVSLPCEVILHIKALQPFESYRILYTHTCPVSVFQDPSLTLPTRVASKKTHNSSIYLSSPSNSLLPEFSHELASQATHRQIRLSPEVANRKHGVFAAIPAFVPCTIGRQRCQHAFPTLLVLWSTGRIGP